MKINFFVLLLFASFLSLPAFSQNDLEESEEEKPEFKDRVYFGGNFGLQFGNFTLIDVSPLVGYMFTNKLSGGVGITYQYLSVKGRGYNYSTSIYGGRVFGRYNITKDFFAYSEYENLRLDYYDPFSEEIVDNAWIPGFMVGGGYFQSFGRRGGITISILYNLLYDDIRSPYNSPWVIRAGFTL